jgi:hypothetical protein
MKRMISFATLLAVREREKTYEIDCCKDDATPKSFLKGLFQIPLPL